MTNRWRLLGFVSLLTACGGTSTSHIADAGSPDATVVADFGPPATTTIAAARQAFASSGASTTPITVHAVVTAVQGPSGDQVIWYVEDPAGGPYSGISVFCDPLAATTCPCKASCTPHVEAPPLDTLVSITGTISSYHNQLQFIPTAQTTLEAKTTPPPVYMASASDLAASATSPYRGVYVKFPSAVTVDNLTPTALYDSECNPSSVIPAPLCSGCSPPTYAGFEVTATGGGTFYVEELFFPFVPLENSPECLTQSGAVAVTMGESFPEMAGILDVDPYAGVQMVGPVQPSDYGQ